ncbi:ABC transporter ATP-binding protein [Clostridium algidicarnis]|uniref:Bacitracin transport system ATP-binding protein n=2 Tax=Clostridium algidicarnis TaxID=37659 RepID=A0A2S6FX59_9CLOT|nr:ABC transporter ATP-binding protein [Clostridium algidicarnis]MBB6631887.1 ABC transporter ATP-binding protein [Clostridium algidicarnis]MBB6698716.1 ABC transporter ATP-binding protein [Clostridium algidicarnis]MBU3219557.1 ABC transporter ATP-binding protein [Clostridium algidicarnis]PPK48123.1 bacitracin transport system ATP-binding protein [Clostridium algidicarnis DSM 15099]
MACILKTYNLTKQYKDHKAVDDVNITIEKGDIYGFLGLNGAGKTTTMRMIMGLIKPTDGNIELFGEKLSEDKKHFFSRIGSIIEFPGFYENLTAVENLDIHRKLMGVPNKDCIEQSLETSGILDAANRKTKEFSLGMKQRLGIARALLHNPEFLVLDEPTNGLDPMGIKEIRQLILDLSQKRHITVLISSHILSEIQQLATKVGIIHEGKLLEEINSETLKKKNRHYIELKVNNDRETVFMLEQKFNITDYIISEPGVIKIYEKLTETSNINRILIQNNVEVKEISILRDNLEDYFIELIGGDINE